MFGLSYGFVRGLLYCYCSSPITSFPSMSAASPLVALMTVGSDDSWERCESTEQPDEKQDDKSTGKKDKKKDEKEECDHLELRKYGNKTTSWWNCKSCGLRMRTEKRDTSEEEKKKDEAKPKDEPKEKEKPEAKPMAYCSRCGGEVWLCCRDHGPLARATAAGWGSATSPIRRAASQDDAEAEERARIIADLGSDDGNPAAGMFAED